MTTRRQLFGLLTGAAALPLVAFEKRANDLQLGSTSWRADKSPYRTVPSVERLVRQQMLADTRKCLVELERKMVDDFRRGRYG